MNKVFLIGLGCLSMVAVPAFAQPAPQGDVTRADAEARLREQLGRVDLNHDGAITQDEVNSVVQMVQQAGGSPQITQRLQMLFEGAAQNGGVRIDTAVQRQLARFDTLDTNHDGTLSAAERQAGMAAAPAAGAAPAAAPAQPR